VILVIMYIETFKTDVIVYISDDKWLKLILKETEYMVRVRVIVFNATFNNISVI
jgi:hypothetical protein